MPGAGWWSSFGPRTFTFVCPTEIAVRSERPAPGLQADAGADVVGVSIDSEYVHLMPGGGATLILKHLPFPMACRREARAH